MYRAEFIGGADNVVLIGGPRTGKTQNPKGKIIRLTTRQHRGEQHQTGAILNGNPESNLGAIQQYKHPHSTREHNFVFSKRFV